MKTFAKLFLKGEIVNYKKKEIIFSPLIKPKGVYKLESGFLYSYSLTSDNKKRIQSILKPGAVLPLLRYVSTARPHFYLEALTNVKLSLLNSDMFFSQVYDDKNLMQELIKSLALYLSYYVEFVENLELETIQKRLFGRLLFFSTQFGVQKNNEIYIEVPLTHELISQSINVSRENVTRELVKLQTEGIITFKRKNLVVLNIKELEKRVQGM